MWIDEEIVNHCEKRLFFKIWFPQKSVIILGSSNQAENEIFIENVGEIPIFKRSGGGGTVVLHDGCLIVGLGAWVENYFANNKYFKILNDSLIETLGRLGNFGFIYQDGISDLACANKKLCGTSLFRSKNYMLFQASILIDAKTDLITKLLKHPTKEPEYRRKRAHCDFLTDLKTLDPQFSRENLLGRFQNHFEKIVQGKLSSDFVDIEDSHAQYLKNRFSRKENAPSV